MHARDQVARRFGVGGDWAVFSTIIPVPHEFLDHTTIELQ